MPTTTIHYYPSSSSFHFFLFSHIEYLLCFFIEREKSSSNGQYKGHLRDCCVCVGLIHQQTFFWLNIIVVYWTFIGWWTKTTRVSFFSFYSQDSRNLIKLFCCWKEKHAFYFVDDHDDHWSIQEEKIITRQITMWMNEWKKNRPNFLNEKKKSK